MPDFPSCRRGDSVEAVSDGLADDLVAAGFGLPSVYLLTGHRLRCYAARGYFQVVDGFMPGTGLIGACVASGRSELVTDVTTRPDFIHAVPGLTGEVCAAVRVHGRVVGAVSVETRGVFPAGVLAVVEAAAAALGERLAELGGLPTPSLSQRLGQFSVALTAAGTPAEVEAGAVQAAAELAEMTTVAVIHLGRGRSAMSTVVGPLAERLKRWTPAELDELASWVTSGTSSHFPGGQDNPPGHAFLLDAGIRSISVHPMVTGGVTTGLLVLVSDVATAHSPDLVNCLEQLAAQTAALLALVRALGEVSRRADLDELTGLDNRSRYPVAVTRALAGLQHRSEAVGVLLLDLDDFKHVNDSLGHHAGDQLLCEVARRLRATLRSDDVACRLGGDEFAIVLPRSSRLAAQTTAERLLDGLAEPFALEGTALRTRASIGIAMSASSADDPQQLLRAADLAMYLAKQRGKGRYALFEPQLQLAALDRLALESDLRRAIGEQRMFLVYQPVVDLHTGALSGVEAFARWSDPQRGDVSPAEFMPVAEESGLVVQLGAWGIQQACAQLHDWDVAGADPALTMAVNVSTRQLERPGLLAVVDGCLARGLDPGRLILEITETALTGDVAYALDTLVQLDGRGVQIAVDGFGTGYSSLDRLRTAPITRLKVDRTFVAEILSADSHVPVVDATLLLSRGFGLAAVAEGVETPAQLAYLRAAGCDYAQGFLLARPLAAGDVPVRPGEALPWAGLLDARSAWVHDRSRSG